MKFLTVCFILFYLYELLYQDKFMRNHINNHLGENEDEFKESTKNNIEIMYFTILIAFIIPVVELFYIAFAFQYEIKITFIYLIWWLIMFIWGRYKQGKMKGIFTVKDKHSKYKIKQMIIDFIHLSYFMYMFYILFIK